MAASFVVRLRRCVNRNPKRERWVHALGAQGRRWATQVRRTAPATSRSCAGQQCHRDWGLTFTTPLVFSLSCASTARILSPATMTTSLYRCPNTGFQVQGYSPEQTSDDDVSYEAVTCLMCKRLHLVNPTTGKVLGEDE